MKSIKKANFNQNSRIYIAGHSGLVGSAFLRYFRQNGYKNLIFKNSSDLNLLDQQKVFDFLKNEKPEYVFIAAAKVGGILANNNYKAQFIYENLQIMTNLIHGSFLSKINNLLFLGSSCIYPKNSPQPIKEEYLLKSKLERTNEPYAISKIAGIKMCEAYNAQYRTNYISVMPTNLYGFNDNFDLETSHVLPALIRKIYLGKCLEENNWEGIYNDLRKRPINKVDNKNNDIEIINILENHGVKTRDNKVLVEIWGSGNPKREFLWVEDLVDACIYIMKNKNITIQNNKDGAIQCSIKQVNNNVFENNLNGYNSHINIGAGNDLSIAELAHLIKKIIGFKGEFVFDNSKPDGTMRKCMDISKLQSIGWTQKVSLENGINKLFKWYLSQDC